MIPSRPLDLGGIVGESFRIVKRTYLRSALLLLLFAAPGFLVLHVGMLKAVDSAEHDLTKLSAVDPTAPLLIRDYLLSEGRSSSASFTLFRFQYADLFEAIDSSMKLSKTKYPDSTSRSRLKCTLDSIAEVATHNTSTFSAYFFGGDELDLAILFFVVGFVILIIGTVGNTTAQYDLSSRAFEERKLDLAAILRYTLSRALWLRLIQYWAIGFTMLCGFGIVTGISFAISPVLGVFGFILGFVALVYAIIRILFSGVILVSEELGPIESIKRSLMLTTDSFWRIFGITLMCLVLIQVVSTIIQIPFSIALPPDLKWVITYMRGGITSFAVLFSQFRAAMYAIEAVSVISALLTAAFVPAFLTTFYYELRTRREGALEYAGGATGKSILL